MITVEDYEIREGGLSFFYNLAAAIGPKFEQFFDQLIEFTLKIANSEDGIKYMKKEEQKEEFSLGSDSDFEDEEDLGMENATAIDVKTTFLNEKAAAIHALGEFALQCPVKFSNYFERAFTIVE